MILSGRTWQVTAPHFCAGIIEAQDGVIIHAAPILRWCINWQMAAFREYCRKRRWHLNVV